MMAEITVTIPQGALRGSERTSELGSKFYGFLQIPYAKPPIGELRFKSPQPADGWEGVRDATKYGPVYPSFNPHTNDVVENSSEDSLFINVFTKEKPENGRNRPVMVWIHGGGFGAGSGNDDLYGPDFIMVHDIVLVTFNYRLGALGFLSLQTPECPGNNGLKDQRLALKWVQDNIAYFGGNPNNVTIFGESAGGASVDCHVLSPSTKGLFHKAIAQSGCAINDWAQASHARECAYVLGKRLGCDTTDDQILFDFLKNAPAKDIVVHSEKILQEIVGVRPGESTVSFAFVPTVEPESENAFFWKNPLDLLNEGDYNDVPYIYGTVSKEGFLALQGPDDFPRWTEDAEFQALIPRELGLEVDTQLSLEIAKKIREYYFKDGMNVQNYVDVLTANFFAYGIYRTVKHHVTSDKITSPNYLYRFSYDGGRGFMKPMLGLQSLKGVCHGDDFSYQFKNSVVPIPLQPGTIDSDVSGNFVQMWVNFAANGAPMPEGSEVAWSPTDAEKMSYLEIDAQLEFKEGYLMDDMKLWDEIYEMAQQS